MRWAEGNNNPSRAPFRRPETVTRNAHGRADAVLAAVQPDLDARDKRIALLRAGALERSALLEEARDALEAAGQNGAHGDDWPAVAPAIRALAAERDQLAADLAARGAEIQQLRAAVSAVRALDPGPLAPGYTDAASEMYDDALRTAIRTLNDALTVTPRPTT